MHKHTIYKVDPLQTQPMSCEVTVTIPYQVVTPLGHTWSWNMNRLETFSSNWLAQGCSRIIGMFFEHHNIPTD